MVDIWFISDTHFFHDNILKFTGDDGKRIRPEFDTVDDMNWCMVEQWNSVVKPQDKVWHLGDVTFKATEKEAEVSALLQKLNGHKRLLVGNHDNVKSRALQNNFEKIELWKGFHEGKYLEKAFTCSHIPLMLSSLRDGKVCVHGHIHQNKMKEKGYVNVCVEHREYTPVHYDTILAEVKAQL